MPYQQRIKVPHCPHQGQHLLFSVPLMTHILTGLRSLMATLAHALLSRTGAGTHGTHTWVLQDTRVPTGSNHPIDKGQLTGPTYYHTWISVYL